jgi:hypothetical protein
MPQWLDPQLIIDRGKNLMAKQLFAYLFRLRSTSIDLAATTTDDIMASDVEEDEA